MLRFIKTNIRENLISSILTLAGVVLLLTAGIVYILTGVTPFTLVLDPLTISLSFVAAFLGLCALVLGFKTVKYLAFLGGLFAFLAFLRYEVTYIANIFVGIDNTSFTPAFLVNLLALLAGMVCFLVAAILQKEVECKGAKAMEEKQS